MQEPLLSSSTSPPLPNPQPPNRNRLSSTSRLLLLARPERATLLIGCVVLLIRLPFSLSIPHFVASVLGDLSNGEFQSAKKSVFLLLICGSIDAALDFWCVFLFGLANQRIVKTLRLTLFNKLLGFEMTFFNENKTGDLLSRLTSDTTEMANDLTWFFR